jgi:hypothetical protein
MFPGNILPNAEFNVKGGKLEVDVFMPLIETGIECKCYTNNIAVANAALQSEAGSIKRQVEGYVSLGLKRVVIITNYGNVDIQKLNSALADQLKGLKGLEEYKLLGSDLTAFARFLEEETKKINDAVSSGMQKEIEQRLSKQLNEGSKE